MFALLIGAAMVAPPQVKTVRLETVPLGLAGPSRLSPFVSIDATLAAPEHSYWKVPELPFSEYRQALDLAASERWASQPQEKAVVQAAAAVLEQGGNASDEIVSETAAGRFDGLRVRPDAQGERLGKLAAGAKAKLHADFDYLPARTGRMGATASFNEHESRVLLPRFDSPEFYPGVLHETRHAWFSELKRRGDIRLFHLQAVALRGAVSPGAMYYTGTLSWEELSNYPKTMRHLISARLRGPALDRYWQLLDVMRSAGHLSEQILRYRPRLRQTVDGLRADIGAVALIVPPSRDADALLRLRAELALELIERSLPQLQALKAALDGEDWSAAGAAADKLVRFASEADAAFVAKR